MTAYALIGMTWDEAECAYVSVCHRLFPARPLWWEGRDFYWSGKRLHGDNFNAILLRYSDISAAGYTMHSFALPLTLAQLRDYRERSDLILAEIRSDEAYYSAAR